MSSLSTENKLQTGNWNAPQIISIDSLFEKYTIGKIFSREEAVKIIAVVNRWKEQVKDHYSQSIEERPIIATYVTSNPKITQRTAHVELPETPNIIYKTFMPNSSELHPMATTLRAPMASIIAEVISSEELNLMAVPKKALFPLFSKEEISNLNEKTINEAFIVCAEKVNVLSAKETIEKVKTMPEEAQERLAHQICTILKKTGLGDVTWPNLQMHRDNGKLYILDTETLAYELFIDKFDEGFEKCAKVVKYRPLKVLAKHSLNLFKMSSSFYQLEVFEKTAQAYLDNL